VHEALKFGNPTKKCPKIIQTGIYITKDMKSKTSPSAWLVFAIESTKAHSLLTLGKSVKQIIALTKQKQVGK